ncbi:hypothetical protein [Haloferula sargassicola]|uniref:Uncharacterized protein n=1 Tax=Haloferula sargassicola TaxID=490096 RepID=A0ABP9UPT0_9BACT
MENPLQPLIATLAAFLVLASCESRPREAPASSRQSDPVRSDPSSWKAWHDLMPGPGPRKLHLRGSVTVPSTLDQARLVRRDAASLEFEVQVEQLKGRGAQVITRRELEFSAPYEGDARQLTVHLPDGSSFQVEIQEVH